MNSLIVVHNQLSKELVQKINDLLPRVDFPTINSSGEFFLLYKTFLIDGYTPLILEVRDSPYSTLGIVPLMFKEYKKRGFLKYNRIRFFGAHFADFSGIIATPANSNLVAQIAIDWLKSSGFKWHEMVLDNLFGESSANALKLALDNSNLRYNTKVGKYHYIDLDRSFESVVADIHKSYVIKNVRLAINRLNINGEWQIESDDLFSVDEFISRAGLIHSQRQKSLGRPSLFDNIDQLNFTREWILIAIQDGSLRTFWLKVNGVDAAYIAGFVQNNRFYLWTTAFLPQFSKYYPGRLLLFKTVELLQSQGILELNFMRGESEYKERWSKCSYPSYRLLIYNTYTIFGKMIYIFDKLFTNKL